MKFSALAGSYRLAASLFLGLAALYGHAGTVPTKPTASSQQAANVTGTVSVGPNGNLLIVHPNLLSRPIPQGLPSRKPLTPFERIVAPHLQQWMKQSQVRAHAQSSSALANGVGGTSVRFPGFVSAPNVVIQNNDSNPAWSSVTADFNNDGKPDVATIQQDGTLNVILNPGSFANIASVTPLTPDTSENVNSPDLAWVTAADLNGDGYPDLVGIDLANNQVVVWIGKGNGTFASAVTYNVAPKSGATWSGGGGIVVADFNGDGFPDVATVEISPVFKAPYQSTVTEQTYLNDGTGKLLPGPETDTVFKDVYFAGTQTLDVISNDGNSASGIVIEILDEGLNGGEASVGVDLITMASNSDGSFQSPTEPTGPLTQDYGIQVTSSMFATNLSTSFNSTSNSSSRRRATAQIRPASTLGTGIPTTDIVFITGDGAIYDAAYTSGNPASAKILAGQNSEASFFGNPSPPTTPSSGAPSLTSYPFQEETVLNVADMDGDGYQDILLYTNGTLYMIPNGGKAAFSGLPTQLVGGTGGDEQPQPANFDGSGNASLVWVDALLNQVGYYQSLNAYQGVTTAAGEFFSAPPVAGVNTTGNYVTLGNNISVQAVGDFNNDGLLDVIAYDWADFDSSSANGNPSIVMGINQGAGTGKNEINNFQFTTLLSPAAVSALPGNNQYGIQGMGSFDPVTVVNAQGTSLLIPTFGGLEMLTIQPDGTPSAPVQLNLGSTPTQCWTSYADVGDVNGDGIPDIVAPYGGDGPCGVNGPTGSGYFTLLGNSDGTFQPATFTPFGSSLYMAKLINLTGQSGKLDLVLLDQDYYNDKFNTYVLPSNGDGTFNQANEVNVAPNYVASDIIVGDFNVDGRQDITLALHGEYDPSDEGVVPNTSGALLIPNEGNYTFGIPTLVDTGYWPIWGVYSDFNGDGAPDLALLNYENEVTSYNPSVEVFPNLGGGNFGPSVSLMDSFFALNRTLSPGYIYPGNFGNTGGQDFIVSTTFNTAEFINQGVTTLALTASPASPGQGAPATLTAIISQASGAPAATGTISFSVGGATLGSAELASSANGTSATFTTTALPVGTDTVTATYSGDQTHNASSATASVVVTAAAPAFALSASPSTLALASGATGTVALNLAANGTFSGAISFTCAGAPSESSCTVSPTSLTLGPNETGTVAVVVATTAKNNQYQASLNSTWKMAVGGISFAGVFLLILPRRRRFSGIYGAFTVALLLFGSIAMLSGCGGGSNKYPGTPTGSSTITVTATSGSITQTQTIALTVTQPQ